MCETMDYIQLREQSNIRKCLDILVCVRTYVDHVKNICHLELANPLRKSTLLVIWQIQNVFNISKNKSLSLVFKPCKSIQETSKEGLFIKVGQIPDSCSTDISIEVSTDSSTDISIEVSTNSSTAVSIENYKIQIFKFDFQPTLTCMCRVSFLTTLDIYKAYFKGRHT